MFGMTDAQKANMLRGQMIRARQCGQMQLSVDKWRALNELLLTRDTGVEPSSEAEEKKYFDMIMRNSRGDTNAE